MGRVCAVAEWTRPEQPIGQSGYDNVFEADVLDTLFEFQHQEIALQENWPAPRLTLRKIVLQRLQFAGQQGAKAAAIRAYVKDLLEREYHVKAVGMTLYRLAKEGLARREGRVWFGVWQDVGMGTDGAVTVFSP